MSATVPPSDSDLLSGLRSGDERALERIFREHYTQLTEEAKRQLEEPARAPRVVERVFVRVWRERERFDTPEALSSFLHEAVHEGAAREASRRSTAHRIAAYEGVHVKKGGKDQAGHPAAPATVDEAWAHVTSTLHAAPDAETSARERAAHERHEKAEHIASIAKKTPVVVPIAIGAAIVVAAAGAFFWLNRATEERAITSSLMSQEAREVKTSPAQRGNITLDDGSVVNLGPQSIMRIARDFGEMNRAVLIDGTATFTVAKGGELPFVVRSRNVAVRATGTKFEVRGYSSDSVVTVRVREDSVTVKVGDETRTLASGSAIAVERNGTIREPSTQALDETLGWVDGRLTFSGRQLREVLAELNRWYAMDIKVPDAKLLDRPVTMTVMLDSSRTTITELQKATGLRYGFVAENRVLYDTTSPPKDVRPWVDTPPAAAKKRASAARR